MLIRNSQNLLLHTIQALPSLVNLRIFYDWDDDSDVNSPPEEEQTIPDFGPITPGTYNPSIQIHAKHRFVLDYRRNQLRFCLPYQTTATAYGALVHHLPSTMPPAVATFKSRFAGAWTKMTRVQWFRTWDLKEERKNFLGPKLFGMHH